VGFVFLIVLVFRLFLSYYVYLHSELRGVMSVAKSVYKRCLVRLYFQLFVGEHMSYLRYLCMFVYLRIVVSNTYCVVFLFCFSSSCVPYVAMCSGLSSLDCPCGNL
jgi:hypothetical protein